MTATSRGAELLRWGLQAFDVKRRVRSLAYVGTRYHCPLCGWRFRHLKPFGEISRPNVQCPRCDSLERHRMLWLFLERSGLLASPKRILHMAPEACLMEKLGRIARDSYVTVDIASPLAKVHADICALPFGTASFDAILCNHVLEHIPDDGRAMRELHRVLRPGGWAILQVPLESDREKTYEDPSIVDPAERSRLFGQSDHLRVYGRDYEARLRAAGFSVSVNRFVDELTLEQRLRWSLPERDDIYLCGKQPSA